MGKAPLAHSSAGGLSPKPDSRSHFGFEALEKPLESKVIFVILLHSDFGLWLA